MTTSTTENEKSRPGAPKPSDGPAANEHLPKQEREKKQQRDRRRNSRQN